MNSLESRELHHLRRDTLDAEAFLASENEPPKERPEREGEEWLVARCAVCRKRRPIPPLMHTCEECFYGEADGLAEETMTPTCEECFYGN